jgi:hypothetical protein
MNIRTLRKESLLSAITLAFGETDVADEGHVFVLEHCRVLAVHHGTWVGGKQIMRLLYRNYIIENN